MVLLKSLCGVCVFFIILATDIYSQRVTNPTTNPIETYSQTNLIANIQSNGLRGHVLFSEIEGTTTIRANIIGGSDKDTYEWKINSLSGMYADGSCSAVSMTTPFMGFDLTVLLGPLEVGQLKMYTTNLQTVNGQNSLIGRTLLLQNIQSGKISCATIMPLGSKKTFEAKFHSLIEGNIYFIQSDNITGIVSSLSYSDEVRKSSTNNWTLMAGLDTDASEEAKYKHQRNKCNTFLGRPFIMDNSSPGTINVGSDPFTISGKTFNGIKNLLPLDLAPVVYIIIYSDENLGNIVSCAPVERVWPLTASAHFNYPQMKGTVTLSQETPLDPTNVDINIELFRTAYSYGIDELPKIIRSRDTTSRECPNINSIIYNPRNIDPDSVPTEGMGTSDQYAIGDLSGKYGNLADKRREAVRLTDFNLPIFGRFSVIGRALVFYAPDGSTIACSNIELINANMTTAFATFDHPIQGQFIFRQPSNNCSADTYVYVEISKPGDDNSTKTINHPWLIHLNQISNSDMNWSTTDCAMAGTHFNPYNVSTNCVYKRDCTQLTPLRCELGDTSSKLGYIDIPPYKVTEDGELDIGKYFFTDVFLPLCGPNNIINKSIVIHNQDFDATPLSCANIIEYKPKMKSKA